MAATVLEISYFDPIILEKKPYFLGPWHIDSKICKERSGAWFPHVYLPLSFEGFMF